jgi:tetratricopeptide (TPR) repeat protein
VLAFEASGADAAPDLEALREGDHHAREACRIDPSCAEAWSTLAYLLHLQGNSRDAVAAARNAIALEPDDWHHHLSLAFVGWGEDRLRAARKLTTLCPGLAMAHWLTASVFIARQAFDAAFEAVRAGCAAQDAQPKASGRFHILGLHLLHGQLLATRGALDEAVTELERELAQNDDGHIYARECYANVWYSIGAIRWRQGDRDGAKAAYREALRRAPAHPMASAGLGVTVSSAAPMDEVIATAVALSLQGKYDQAAQVCSDAIAAAPPGPEGWTIPIDPLLQATSHQEAWGKTLAILRDRAA